MLKKYLTEASLQAAINKDLRQLGIRYKHDEAGSGRNRTHRGGFPDLCIFPGSGKVIFVEIKNGNKKLRPEQAEFRLWAMQNSYTFWLVRSWAEWEMIKNIEGLHVV